MVSGPSAVLVQQHILKEIIETEETDAVLKIDSGRLSFKKLKTATWRSEFRNNQNAIITTELVARADFFHHLP